MRKLVITIVCMFLVVGFATAAPSTDHLPVEITSSGETRYEGGLATARDNVAIHVGDTDLYADFAQYDSRTHDISLEGHVRIYRDAKLYLVDRGVYNTETKEIRGTETRT
jgi:lipopolysaccharide assembly outer membrane protein LptD (OstA)